MDKRPIGVLDSGLGGLTVLSALKNQLPHSRFVYLADTARNPYGTKSPDTLERYAFENAQFLIEKENIQVLVVACGTLSAWVLPKLVAHLPIPVVGVIEPCVDALVEMHRFQSMAVLATRATVASRAYTAYLRKKGFLGDMAEVACQMCVALVEEGWCDHPATEAAVQHYVGLLPPVEGVILGCTHFPLLMPLWKKYLPARTTVIDPAYAVAQTVKALLLKEKLSILSPSLPDRYIVTGDPKQFVDSAKHFGWKGMPVEQVVLP